MAGRERAASPEPSKAPSSYRPAIGYRRADSDQERSGIDNEHHHADATRGRHVAGPGGDGPNSDNSPRTAALHSPRAGNVPPVEPRYLRAAPRRRLAAAKATESAPDSKPKAPTGLAERTPNQFAQRRGDPGSRTTTTQELTTILALVDELASLAADLWFAGQLDELAFEPEPDDAD